ELRGGTGSEMADAPEPDEATILDTLVLARLILDPEVSLQAPPNLNPSSIEGLLSAGINDFGGISPITPDYINPRHPWPHVLTLADSCRRMGFALCPRPPIYDRFIREDWLDPKLLDVTRAVQARFAGGSVGMSPTRTRGRDGAPFKGLRRG